MTIAVPEAQGLHLEYTIQSGGHSGYLTGAGWNVEQSSVTPNPSTTIAFPAAQGQYVRIQLSGTNNSSLAEFHTWGQNAMSANTSFAFERREGGRR
jgi:hypothetical protein